MENKEPLIRYTVKLAQLGGYLARANDPPNGNTVIWRGLRRLTDIQLGFELAKKMVGDRKADGLHTIQPCRTAALLFNGYKKAPRAQG